MVCGLLLATSAVEGQVPATPARSSVTGKLSDAGLPLTQIPPELAPKEAPRRIAVIFGWKNLEKAPVWPIDTLTARRFQLPLEWLGYECDYHHISRGVPPALDASIYAGVIFDEQLEVPAEVESGLAEWVMARVKENTKVLFVGAFPFRQSHSAGIVAHTLGIRGVGTSSTRPAEVKVDILDKQLMNFEAPVQPRTLGFEPFVAPAGARVLLGLRGQLPSGEEQSYQPIFVADWGGAVIGPYLTFAASVDDQYSYLDPFGFLSLLWPGGFPAPDTTTRNGLRIFFSHIDGDGFASASNLPGNRTCAEEIRDHILKAFPLPITVSVVESTTRAVEAGLDPAKRPEYEKLAREIFALPNVQPASHAYSHPFVWMENDPDAHGVYERLNLELVATENYPKILADREITGSLEYMAKNLLPADRKPGLMLWSGNCRPGAAALAIARQGGWENLNGGDTYISAEHPAIAGISPRCIPWEDELQIFAANQNEFPYTLSWKGPFYGGFTHVIETFQRTGGPRRLKPVNIYFHFYSGSGAESLGALKNAFAWAMEQDLAAISAVDYVRLVKDARSTRITSTGLKSWSIFSGGENRTFRLPAKLGWPDMATCLGVLGWRQDGDFLYVATDGSPRVDLHLADKLPSPYLRLESCSGPLRINRWTPKGAQFSVSDFREVMISFAGLPPGAETKVTLDGGSSTPGKADKDGRLRLKLPKTTSVEIQIVSAD